MTLDPEMLKHAWRCSRVTPMPATVEELVAATHQIRHTFNLSRREHRLVCEEALRRGEQRLANELLCLEQQGPQPQRPYRPRRKRVGPLT